MVAFALLMLTAPLALDGESATSNSKGLAIISIVSIVSGYIALALLWRFVFSKKARSKRERDPPEF
jgi:hypothetical protein